MSSVMSWRRFVVIGDPCQMERAASSHSMLIPRTRLSAANCLIPMSPVIDGHNVHAGSPIFGNKWFPKALGFGVSEG